MNSESKQPRYTLDIGGETHEVGSSAFRVVLYDTAHFFCTAGDLVPHFFAGHSESDVLLCMERGVRTRVEVGDPALLSRLRELVPRD